ncbi:putative actin binding protein [Phaeomoniella chlamydospora]|uniref:Putative actin binding protein n=1 Tax=Phaeomoniella chlamydospora TaxID=158046 RepID=A0A0G2GD05_PHACM|nr:putative actin binding protein [Phaeomoniella chlamydospora]
MSSLNLSTNGPSITKSYKSVVEASAPAGPAASSPTYGQWAVFSVAAPLVNAFQQDSSKESVLKVQSTGEGELVDLIDEFSDGRIQFAFVKVKDPNSGLPKNVLIAWCGEGVPERTKGYFTSHLTAVAKLLHGYHVQVTARSESDLTPERIVQKVADASGAKYSAGSAPPQIATNTKPSVASKPAFTPTQSSGAGSAFNAASRLRGGQPRNESVDEDGWGADAPPVTRTQLEKVAPAYQPTKVNLQNLKSQGSAQSSFQTSSVPNTTTSDVVKGGYQPIGKVDINAIRRQAKESGAVQDDRPVPVKGSYEPVGKVDIAAIRARSHKPVDTIPSAPESSAAPSRSVADRSSTFAESERLTSLPKPKVANKFGGGSTFTGTTAPTPGGFGAKPAPAAPVGSASRTFADQGGKTPAQLWAEKKAAREGQTLHTTTAPSATSPIQSQASGSGQWESGYAGKKWAPVSTTATGKSAGSLGQQATGSQPDVEERTLEPQAAGIGGLRDRFSAAPPMGSPAFTAPFDRPAPEPVESTKPNRGQGVPIPGLTSAEPEAPSFPTPPTQPRSPTPPTPEFRASSPPRIAMPVGRTAAEEVTDVHEEQTSPPPPMPVRAVQEVAAQEQEADDHPEPDSGRTAAVIAATTSLGEEAVGSNPPFSGSKGKTAIAQYDYDADESNEISLKEGEHVTDIDMVDEDWWMGTNSQGQSGLFPSNYVELVEEDADSVPASEVQTAAPTEAAHTGQGATAISLYDYEAAESNELSFPEGVKITNIVFPDDDWWMGEYNGQSGLFPANYVQLDE